MAQTFGRAEHIRRRADYKQIYASGVRVSGRLMTIFARSGGDGPARLGIAATRKLGRAVIRNRAKRLVRELFRQRKPAAGLDIVVVPHREFLDVSFTSLERELDALLERARHKAARLPGAGGPRRPGRNPGV